MFWNNDFKTIEAEFGSGVVSYFVFLRWLLILNFRILLLITGFLVIPQVNCLLNLLPELLTRQRIASSDNLNATFLHKYTNGFQAVLHRNQQADEAVMRLALSQNMSDEIASLSIGYNLTIHCSALYALERSNSNVVQPVLDFIKGTVNYLPKIDVAAVWEYP